VRSSQQQKEEICLAQVAHCKYCAKKLFIGRVFQQDAHYNAILVFFVRGQHKMFSVDAMQSLQAAPTDQAPLSPTEL
jgi:hypothetical protein